MDPLAAIAHSQLPVRVPVILVQTYSFHMLLASYRCCKEAEDIPFLTDAVTKPATALLTNYCYNTTLTLTPFPTPSCSTMDKLVQAMHCPSNKTLSQLLKQTESHSDLCVRGQTQPCLALVLNKPYLKDVTVYNRCA